MLRPISIYIYLLTQFSVVPIDNAKLVSKYKSSLMVENSDLPRKNLSLNLEISSCEFNCFPFC